MKGFPKTKHVMVSTPKLLVKIRLILLHPYTSFFLLYLVVSLIGLAL